MKPRDPTEAPDAWLKLADTAWAYEKDRVERWRNEINALLVFAGLFSAVLTAFVVQYYAVLLPAPDPNTAILERISAQLGNTATNTVVAAASSESSVSARILTGRTNSSSISSPSPPTAPRWIASLWFVALVFSLSAASIALAVNQWLNFHATEQAGLQDASQKAWTWQLRRRALEEWKVEYMVSILPLLLQVALVLFLVGFAGYLSELGFDIAVPSTFCVGALLLFLAFTSVSPALVGYSPYKSPQAWWICQACRSIRWVAYWPSLRLHRMITACLGIRPPVWHSSLRARQIYRWMEGIRQFLAQREARARTLMTTTDWLAHEQLYLDNLITRREEKSLFTDIYSIADDTDVLRAMGTCMRAMPIARAITNVTEIGQTAFVALSKR
ncbi:uncharacterized protein B0H18DRAFT_933426, partial [Fomitopsis serialis]|uniref:uncharacterized protein n=1 Tax=Fomitopsis serialis TaxID=139415 RepID=UPI002008CE57